MLYTDRESVLRIKMIFGNACFLRTLVNGVFLLQACMHYDGGFLVVNNHFACGVHDESAHSLSQDKSEGWFYGAFIFTG